jgi:hypothetical protein
MRWRTDGCPVASLKEKLRPRVRQVSEHVFHVRFLGTEYRLELGGEKGRWEKPIVSYRIGGRWESTTLTQEQFIIDVVYRNSGVEK